MVKFIEQGVNGLPKKRKHVEEACESCRKKKKRCIHSGPDETLTSSAMLTGRNLEANDEGHTSSRTLRSRRFDAPPLDNSEPSSDSDTGANDPRFVGDLNPEAALLVATSPSNSNTTLRDGTVGVWYPGNSINRPKRISNLPFRKPRLKNIFYGDPLIQKTFLPYLEDHCFNCVPPDLQYEALKDIYYKMIHPLLPIIPSQLLLQPESSNPSLVLLKQAVCLAASVQPEATSSLWLPAEKLMKGPEFRQKLSSAMRTMIDFGFIKDKITLARACGILSLFSQTTNGGDTAAQLNGKAVHYAQSLGLQIGNQDIDQKYEAAEATYCCIWAIDHLNACFYGRPLLMHERDSGRDMFACIQNQPPGFRLLLEIISHLDSVISNYRPTEKVQETVSWHFPEFEVMVLNAGADSLELSLLATVETLYHAVYILAQRPEFSDTPEMTTTPAIRQRLAALRITAIISQEFPELLTLFPFVPYALSLALSVAYRELRQSRLPTYQSRAQAQIQTCCDLLKQFGSVFPSALFVSKMGEQILKDAVASNLTSSRKDLNKETSTSAQRTTEYNNEQNGLAQTFESSKGVISYESPSLNSEPVGNISGSYDFSFDFDEIDAFLGGQLSLCPPLDFDFISKYE